MKRIARVLCGCCALGSVVLLSTASAQVKTEAEADLSPSKLDYVVLASMVDSPSLMGMSVSRARDRRVAAHP